MKNRNMMVDSQETYATLMRLFPSLKENQRIEHNRKLENEPWMTLHMDVQGVEGKYLLISIAHTSIQNGDVMSDPLMFVLLDRVRKTAHPQCFQNDYAGVYHEVFDCTFRDDMLDNADQQQYISQLQFLQLWCSNLVAQGFEDVANV